MSDTRSKILEGLDLKNGNVTYNDFDIDPNLPFEQQKWSFKQDLLQIVFDGKYLIDVEWYPSKDLDWPEPFLRETCRDYYKLKKYLQKAMNFTADLSLNIAQ